MNSQRLPGKVMLEILQKPIIRHIYDRLKISKTLHDVVISTGKFQDNKSICEYAQNHAIPYFSGSENDLIDRLYQTTIKFNADAIVRITSDCPLVDPQIVDELVTEFLHNNDKYDIVTNCKIRTFPHGLDAEVYSLNILRKLWQEIKEPQLREWFPFYIEKNPSQFRILNIENTTDQHNLRWTVDYPEDFQFVKSVYENLYEKNNAFGMKEILQLLQTKPELSNINSKYVNHHNVGSPKV